MRPGLGAHRHRRHAGHFEEPAAELGDQVDRAGHRRQRLQRVDVAEARQPRHLLVEARVVLHGAGAERIEPGVDRVVLLGEPHIVAHRLRLGQAGQVDRRLPGMLAEARLRLGRLRQVDAGHIVPAGLEDQRLLDLQAAIAGEGLGSASLAAASGRVGRPWSFSIRDSKLPLSCPRKRAPGKRCRARAETAVVTGPRIRGDDRSCHATTSRSAAA